MAEATENRITSSIGAFSRGLVGAFSSIMGVSLEARADFVPYSQFDTKFTTIASVPFSGSVTGEFFICLNRDDWLPRLANISGLLISDEELVNLAYSTFKEIINTAGGEAIGVVRDSFGPTTMMTPRLIEGKLFYPSTKIYNIALKDTAAGIEIEARFSVDLMEQEINVEHEKLKLDSKMDETGLYNKKYFQEVLDSMDEMFANVGSFSVVFLDINRLKFVNDTYGHDAGDSFIKHAANIVRQSCRFSDYCFRHGGDEIVILLPKCSLDESFHVVNRIQDLMKTTCIKVNEAGKEKKQAKAEKAKNMEEEWT